MSEHIFPSTNIAIIMTFNQKNSGWEGCTWFSFSQYPITSQGETQREALINLLRNITTYLEERI